MCDEMMNSPELALFMLIGAASISFGALLIFLFSIFSLFHWFKKS